MQPCRFKKRQRFCNSGSSLLHTDVCLSRLPKIAEGSLRNADGGESLVEKKKSTFTISMISKFNRTFFLCCHTRKLVDQSRLLGTIDNALVFPLFREFSFF